MIQTILNYRKQQFVLRFSFILFVTATFRLNAQVFPLSDLQNSGNWMLIEDLSDEFTQGSIDEDKWQIQGKDGIYKSGFIGRQPSQFSPNNALVENDKLKIRTKWEPDFPFNSGTTIQCGETYIYENITTAAVISKQQFHYGYMEIKSKAANAAITSSFWTTGYQSSELDMFEMFGGPKEGVNPAWKKRLKLNMISWDPSNYYYLPDGKGPAYTENIQADHNTADAFHVYGFDWTPEYLKVYIDGVLKSEIYKSDLTKNGADPDAWVTDTPYWLWFDSETFCWLGLPDEAELPVDYEIEYIRVWEKRNLLNPNFFAFEGSIFIDDNKQDWFIPGASSNNMTITNEKPYRWYRSLKFSHNGPLTQNAVAFAPFGSVKLNSGDFTLSTKVWLEASSTLTSFQVILENPYQILNFDITNIETGKWVELSRNFTRNINSENNDRLRIRITPNDATSGSSTLYIDDISIIENNALTIDSFESNTVLSKIFPNPVNSSHLNKIQITSPEANHITLYTLTGVKLKEYEKTEEPMALDISQLKPGIYFLSLRSNLKIETKKLIIK